MELNLKSQKKSEGANLGTHGPDDAQKSDLPLLRNHEHTHTANLINSNVSASEFASAKK
ncbi:MAG: hypothetical protein ACREAE_07500 [Nitrosopumilaceae archaeon]